MPWLASVRIASVVLGAAITAGAASAATFDFGQLAEDVKAQAGKELQWAEHFGPGGGWTVDGITVVATDNAHLDASFRSGVFTSAPSGLGMCNDPSGDCNASDWDGIRDAGEILTLIFDQVISAVWTLRETTAAWHAGTGPDHTLMEGCARVNGTDYGISSGFLEGLAPSASWTFEPCVTDAFGAYDYYVTAVTTVTPPAPIPLPAGVLLLGSALGLLGWRARRRAA